jgi:5'-methylthioadenosine phosphorylase
VAGGASLYSTAMVAIPRVAHAVVGGSGTSALEFPAGLQDPRVRILAAGIQLDTPFGQTPALTHIVVAGPNGGQREAMAVAMHGWVPGSDRRQSSLALFWALREAGVRRIVAESGVGSITQNFRPRDLVVPHDVLDLTPQVGGRIAPEHRVIMRQPFCPEIRGRLWDGAQRMAADRATRAFDRAVCVATEGTRFETAAEVNAYARLGGDLVGAGICPEVFLAREIGACYAALAGVLNYAEGVRPQWDYELLEEIVHEDARQIADLLLTALMQVPDTIGCNCATYRKPVAFGGRVAALTDTA